MASLFQSINALKKGERTRLLSCIDVTFTRDERFVGQAKHMCNQATPFRQMSGNGLLKGSIGADSLIFAASQLLLLFLTFFFCPSQLRLSPTSQLALRLL
jgi:hypothetical protein